MSAVTIAISGFAIWLGLLAFWVACASWVEYRRGPKRGERPRLVVQR